MLPGNRSLASALFGLALLLGGAPAGAAPLRAVATTPDPGSLVREVGGDAVDVTSLAKGPEDAHFVEPRPSFVSRLHRADLLVTVGMDLEVGWLPVLLRSARNPRIQRGAPGYLDASTTILPIEVPRGVVDRSMGDVHIYGNPHYLLDPLNGLRAAAAIRDRLTELRPEDEARFAARYDAFASRLMEKLVGPDLSAGRSPAELARELEKGELADEAGGWLGRGRALAGKPAVQDHRTWSYLVNRFGLVTVATLEPRPGIAPTTRHLGQVVETVQGRRGAVILATSYFDARHARWVAERTGARVVPLAHQVGARPGTDDYLAMLDFNLRQLVGASRPAEEEP